MIGNSNWYGDFYKQADMWGNAPEPYQIQVLTDILSLLPQDISSILDVGCGDGYITNALPKNIKVVGVDLSQEALRHVRHETQVGSITAIPFPDKAFDLVMANDILEHLLDIDLDTALTELQRVAIKYILLTVPLNEHLEANFTKCANCGTVYHINYHTRTFTEQSFLKIFRNNFQLVELRLSGGINAFPYDPTSAIRHELGIYHTWGKAICPKCQSKKQVEFDKISNLIRVFNTERTVCWGERLKKSGIWNDRSEIIGLFSALSNHYSPKPIPFINSEKRDIFSIDFSNPLQIVQDDFVPGSFIGKYFLPAEVKFHEGGLTLSHPSSSYYRVPIRIQTKPEIGDMISVIASGNSEKDIFSLYTIDGLTCKEKLIYQSSVSGLNQEFTFTLKEDWTADNFGWALDLYLCGQVKLHDLQHIPHKVSSSKTDFLQLEVGHNVIRYQSENICYSWGLMVDKPGFYPDPQLGILFSKSESLSEEQFSMQRIFSSIEQFTNILLKQLSATQEQLSATQEQLSATQEQLYSLRGAWGSSRELLRSIKRKKTWNELLRHSKRLIWYNTIEPPKEHYPSPPWNKLEKLPEITKNKLRVLVLSHMFPHPAQPTLGTFVLEQVKALREYANVDARVLVGRPYFINRSYSPFDWFHWNRSYFRFYDESYWQELEGVPVKYVPYRIIPVGFWSHGWSYRQGICRGIEQIYRDFPFQIIHAHTSYLDGSAAYAIAKQLGAPIIITEHTGPFSNLTQNVIVRQWTKRSLQNASGIIAVSTAQKNNIMPYIPSYHYGKIMIVHNGVDTRLFYPPKQWMPNSKSPRIVFVGSCEPIKNIPLLLQAIAKVRQQIPKISLKIVGRAQITEEKEKIDALISRLALDNCVTFLGQQSREGVAYILREETDILALPSKAETFGCVLIEALASGKPVIATRCGGPEDIITEKYLGQLCNNDDVDDLARALLEVAEKIETFSPTRMRKYATEHFGFISIAKQISDIYDRIL